MLIAVGASRAVTVVACRRLRRSREQGVAAMPTAACVLRAFVRRRAQTTVRRLLLDSNGRFSFDKTARRDLGNVVRVEIYQNGDGDLPTSLPDIALNGSAGTIKVDSSRTVEVRIHVPTFGACDERGLQWDATATLNLRASSERTIHVDAGVAQSRGNVSWLLEQHERGGLGLALKSKGTPLPVTAQLRNGRFAIVYRIDDVESGSVQVKAAGSVSGVPLQVKNKALTISQVQRKEHGRRLDPADLAQHTAEWFLEFIAQDWDDVAPLVERSTLGRYLDGLRQQNGAFPLSGAPARMRRGTEQLPFPVQIAFRLRDLKPFDDPLASNNGEPPSRGAWEKRFDSGRLAYVVWGAPGGRKTFDLGFGAAQTLAGAATRARASAESVDHRDEEAPPALHLRGKLTPESAQTLRIGALDLVTDDRTGAESELRIDAMPIVLPAFGEAPPLASASMSWHVPLADVLPGGADPVPDDDIDEAPPIVFRATRPTSAARRFELQLDESIAPGRRRALRLAVRAVTDVRSAGSAAARGPIDFDGNVDVVTLGINPLFAARVTVRRFADASSGNELIAVWEDTQREGTRWQISGAGDQRFALHLPPQALGEATERMRGDASIKHRRTIDYRLGRGAVLDLTASVTRKFLDEPPWNLRRILGYPGQRAPGAFVNGATFELVYGLTTTLTDAEASQETRLTEIFARLGAPPPPLPPRVGDDIAGYASCWNALHHAYRHRLGVYEFYSAGDRRQRRSADGVWAATGAYYADDGLRFKFRGSADLFRPITTETGSAPDGLKGGVTWGVDTEAEIKALRGNPVSRQGTIHDVRVSALGAWGEQRAQFNDGRTQISVQTRMGRVSRYTVETIGRIKQHRNRARYVRVYSRTVLPSEQFRCEQDRHAGRPLLRLTEAYVELLQPERGLPDNDASPKSRGLLVRTSFGTRRIPVNPNWVRETTEGFLIPLWDPGADQQIYPKPDIRLVLARSAVEGLPDLPVQADRPQQFAFHAITVAELDGVRITDDTDAWPAVLGIEYTNAPHPEPEDGVEMRSDQPESLANLDASDPRDSLALPSAPDVPPGFEDFTIHLAPNAPPVNITAERQDTAVLASLSTVTIMRAAPSAQSSGKDIVRPLQRARALLDQVRHVLAAPGATAEAVRESVRGALADVRHAQDGLDGEINRARDALQTATSATVSGGLSGPIEQWFLARAESTANDLLMSVRLALSTARRAAERVADPLPVAEIKARVRAEVSHLLAASSAAVAKLGFDALADLQASVAGVAQRLNRGFDDVKSDIQNANTNLDAARKAAKSLRDCVVAAFDELLAMLPSPSNGVLVVLVDWTRRQLLGVRQSLLGPVDELLGALDTNLPQVGDKLAAVELAIGGGQAAFDAAVGPVIGAIADARDRWRAIKVPLPDGNTLGTLADWWTRLPERLDGIIDAAAAGAPTIPSGTLCAALDAVSDTIARRETVELVHSAVRSAARTAAGALSASVNAQVNTAAVLDKDLSALQDALKGAREKLETLLDLAADALIAGVGSLARALGEQLQPLDRIVRNATSALDQLQQSPTFQNPDETLRLIRAVGSGPLVPGLEFNRKRIAYVFDDAADAIRTSPVAALVNRLGDDLESLGIRLPIRGLGRELLPANLPKCDLESIFPSFASLRGLFKKVKFPDLGQGEAIKITHGLDKASQSAWLRALVDTTLDDNTPLFDAFGARLALRSGRMRGRAELTIDAEARTSKVAEADVTGTWELSFARQPVVRFVDTALRMDRSGNVRFDVRADRIELESALEWLSDLVKSFGSPEDGLLVALVRDPDGRPRGVRATLSLPVPPLSFGAFAITNLQLGTLLELMLEGKSFYIGTGANLGREQQPFTLTIAFLGGAGYLESYVRYYPMERKTTALLRIGIFAAAGFALAAGPVGGSVMVYFGIAAQYSAGGARASNGLTVAIRLMIVGGATVFSCIRVGLELVLEAVYKSDGSLVGHGSLSISVRLSRFVRVRVRRNVRHVMKRGGSARALAMGDPWQAMRASATQRYALLG
jgi:hypothetical protein